MTSRTLVRLAPRFSWSKAVSGRSGGGRVERKEKKKREQREKEQAVLSAQILRLTEAEAQAELALGSISPEEVHEQCRLLIKC